MQFGQKTESDCWCKWGKIPDWSITEDYTMIRLDEMKDRTE